MEHSSERQKQHPLSGLQGTLYSGKLNAYEQLGSTLLLTHVPLQSDARSEGDGGQPMDCRYLYNTLKIEASTGWTLEKSAGNMRYRSL